MARTSGPTPRASSARRPYQPPNSIASRVAPRGPAREGTSSVQLKVTGWRQSKAASNDDGGVASLKGFLERRATLKKKSPVRIRKTRVEGDILLVTATAEDAKFIAMVNNLTFAGVPITVEIMMAMGRSSTPAERPQVTFSFLRNNGAVDNKDDYTLSPAQITEKLKAVLASRYAVDAKFLDLSDLASHPEIQALGFKGNPFSRPSFFPALMKVVDASFATLQAKTEAIQSVSLARNRLHRVTPIRPLAQTFPGLKNLDLSGNLFEDMGAIGAWRKEFPQLEHIILTDTKLEENVPDFRAQLIRWYPKIRIIDQQPVTEAEAAAARTIKPLPPVRGPVWEDRDQVGENFVRMFFEGLDTDRKALVEYFYDNNSKFSLSVNTSALRDPATQEKQKAQSWGQYIPQSRNLTKISHAGARAKRLHRGKTEIFKAYMGLPATRHPTFGADDLHKWLLECRPQSRVPDPSGQHPLGVDGLVVTVHGQFDELDALGDPAITRSFDRTFVLGPGGLNGVRVVNDMITLRAYGGTEAFKSDDRSSTPDEKQKMLAEVQKQTGMNAHYSSLCLEQTAWSLIEALAAFERERANIPQEAFVS